MATIIEARQKQYNVPDIFHAASVDDPDELIRALAEGQQLDICKPDLLNMTPVHVACIRSSNAFLAIAVMEDSFDPWLRDDNLRVAFDHAAARGNKIAMQLTLDAMYPGEAHGFSKLEL